jgi:23S rRNA pseudouridine1911/1915/1917 synthase
MTETEKSKLIISTHAAEDGAADDAPEESEAGSELELREAVVPVGNHGERLDRTLAGIVPEFSRSYLQQLIDAGCVHINAALAQKSSVRVKAGDRLRIELRPTPQSQAFKPEIMDLSVVFEDDYLLVIDKPAGLVVHPAPGNWSGTLLNGLLGRDQQAAFLPRAGIVHRLDKDTSGLMVVARQRLVMDRLVALIAERRVSREYMALAHGAWKGPSTRKVSSPIGRDPRNRLRMAVVDLDRNPGKTALTTFDVLQTSATHCLVRCKLHTGRTHQIRVHMAELLHPLVGDDLYGGHPEAGLTRQGLHACQLAFVHPVTGVDLKFHSTLPPDLKTAVSRLGLIYNESQQL